MIWLRPYWLLALIPLAVLLWWCWQRRPAGASWQKLLPAHLAKHLLTGQEGAQSRWPLLMLALAWLLATLAMAGPSWEQDKYPLYQLKGGRVLVMDMSNSMRATDLSPDRLTQAKFKAIDLVRQLKEGETGLVAYAGAAFTVAPMTRDGSTLEYLIQALSPEIMPVQGSRSDLGIEKAVDLLKQAGYRRGDILLFTDGLNDKERSLISKLDLGPFKVSALVFGTDQGAPIRSLSGELLKDDKGQVVIAKSHLSETCSVIAGLCIKAGLDDGDLKTLLTPKDDGQTKSNEVITLPKDGGRYLLWLLVPLVLLAFRRGLLVLALVALLPMVKPAEAAVFKNDNQQGYQQYQDKDYAQAAKTFTDPNWQAAALYRDGKYQQAADLWAKQSGASAHFNEGNALAKAGKLDQAISAYDEALDTQPDFPDARFNRDLVKKQLDQQKKDGKGDDKKSGKDNNKDQNKDGKSSSKPNQQDDKGNKNNKPGQQKDGNKGQDPQQQPKADNQSGQDKKKDQGQSGQQQKPQQPKDGKDDQGMTPQGADKKGDDKARQQPAQLSKGDGQSQGPMMSADKLLDAVNNDPGYLLQQKMLRAYEAQAKKGKEQQQW